MAVDKTTMTSQELADSLTLVFVGAVCHTLPEEYTSKPLLPATIALYAGLGIFTGAWAHPTKRGVTTHWYLSTDNCLEVYTYGAPASEKRTS